MHDMTKQATVPAFEGRRLHDCIETAAYLSVCPETVRRLSRKKKLQRVAGLRKLLFTTEAIEAFLRGDAR